MAWWVSGLTAGGAVAAARAPRDWRILRLLAFASELVVAPTSAFRRLSDAPGWLFPLAGAAVLAALVHVASIPFTVALVRNLAGPASESALDGLERWLMVIGGVRAAWVVLKAAFMCWILWLTLSLKGETVRGRRLMIVASYASLAFIAEDALRLAVFWLRGIDQIRGPQDLQSFTGLDAFVVTANMGIVGRLLLAQVSLFSVWFVALIRGGLIGLERISARSATTTAVLCWFYLLLLQLGVALVVASVQGGATAPGL